MIFVILAGFLRRRSPKSSPESVTDTTRLMERIAAQEQDALALLYDQYGSAVYSLALRVVLNRAVAEEVTQDTFLKVWNGAENWDAAQGRLSSWLLTIARYTAIDRLRREKRQPTQVQLEPLSDILEDHQQDWQHRGHMLRSLLEELPPEQAQIIELAFFQGMTHSRMAEVLQLPLGTVKTRLRLGLQKLKEMVGDE